MIQRPHRTSSVTGHAYSVPVVRELPPQPLAGGRTW
jgi:hypothetical protein